MHQPIIDVTKHNKNIQNNALINTLINQQNKYNNYKK